MIGGDFIFILDRIKELFDFNNKTTTNARIRKRKLKFYKGYSVTFNKGVYSADNSDNDYKVDYIVKNGEVKEEIIKAKNPKDDANLFDIVKLTPITPTAYVRILNQSASFGANGKRMIWTDKESLNPRINNLKRIILKKQLQGVPKSNLIFRI